MLEIEFKIEHNESQWIDLRDEEKIKFMFDVGAKLTSNWRVGGGR